MADFAARFAQAFCDASSRCCNFSGGSKAGDCEADTAAEQLQNAAAAKAGGATFDEQAAADCLTALAEASCEIDPVTLLRQVLPACDV